MDQTQPAQEDFDIWEFVTCSKCQLAFSSDGVSGPSVPFWITECGHVLCNSHLNADQSCPSCNAQRIEVMPLQKEMPSPFSDWFCSLPFKLDALAQAAKFQHERMAGSARYYKSRYEQYRTVLGRMKNEISQVKALRKEIEALKSENARLRGGWSDQQQQQPAPYVNMNGKRRLLDNRVATSSPRSIHTPIGPPRITLPPDHDPPPSLAQLGTSGTSNSGDGPRQQPSSSRQPPGSSQFSQQYAYNRPQSQQMQIPTQQVLSYEQQAPIRQQMQQGDRRLMPPPPTPVQGRQLNALPQFRQPQRLATPRVSDQMQINQNPPQMQNPQNPGTSYIQNPGGRQFQSFGQAPRRFVPLAATNSNTNAGPSNQRFVPQTPSSSQHRFVPVTAPTGDGRRFVSANTSGSRAVQGTSQGAGFGNGRAQRSAFAPPG